MTDRECATRALARHSNEAASRLDPGDWIMEYCVVRLNNQELLTVGAARVDRQGVDRVLGRASTSEVDSLHAFVQHVQQLLAAGWEPAGGPVVISGGTPVREQALVKRS